MMTIQQLLLLILLTGLGVWIGGAISLQVLIARAQLRNEYTQTITLMRQILWIVTRLFVPIGMLGVLAGVGLVFVTDAQFSDTYVFLPLLLYLMIALVGTFFSFPEYQRLDKLAQERGDDDMEVQQRLNRAAWVNRIELVIVYSFIVFIIRSVVE